MLQNPNGEQEDLRFVYALPGYISCFGYTSPVNQRRTEHTKKGVNPLEWPSALRRQLFGLLFAASASDSFIMSRQGHYKSRPKQGLGRQMASRAVDSATHSRYARVHSPRSTTNCLSNDIWKQRKQTLRAPRAMQRLALFLLLMVIIIHDAGMRELN